jgi:signal-transduction protein with cAMP-binding, CBS, and nucleotidyltransferase domain
MENEKLYKILAGNYPLKPELKELLNQMISREYYEKNQIILKPGQIANRTWFMEQGTATGYMYTDNKKVTLWFRKDNKLIIPVKSFFTQKPSDIYIKVLEPSILYSITYDQLQEVKKNFPESHDYINKIIQENHEELEHRYVEFARLSSEERYMRLWKEFPSIFLKASAESIAAYLGISRKTLYRIRTRTRRS